MRLTLVLGMVGLSAVLFACSSSDSGDAGAGGAATAAATAAATSAAPAAMTESTIDVTLSDFAIALSAATVPAGKITINAENTGATPHEVVVLKTDLAEDQLPIKDAMVDEGQVGAIGEVEEFAAGSKASGTFELAAGRYVLICNVAGHYQLGMRTVLTVE